MSQKMRAHILGMGSYLPEKILTNADLEKIVDTTDEWITTRTGIKQRHIAAVDESTSDMGAKAARLAIADAGLSVDDIDLIVVATMTPDKLCPATAPLIQAKLGASHVGAFDVGAACSGYIYALSVAKSFVESGAYCNVLVVATEKMSAMTDFTDRNTCILFGDGAGAVVVSSEEKGFAIDEITLGADGDHADLMTIEAGGASLSASHETVDARQHFFKMRGKQVYRLAVKVMGQLVQDCNKENLVAIIPHQANARIIEGIGKRLSQKVYNVVERYGNTSASSIPIATLDYIKEHELEVGQRLLLAAFGAGSTWGGAIIRKI